MMIWVGGVFLATYSPGFKKAFMLLDVLFIYKGGMLFHYSGTFGGWEFYKAVQMPENEVDEFIKEWARGDS